MEPQIVAWSKLSDNIKTLNISVKLEQLGPTFIIPPIAVLESKQTEGWEKLVLFINKSPHNLLLYFLDQQIIDFKLEVERNQVLLSGDNSLVIYFSEIYLTLDEFFQNLKYNHELSSWVFNLVNHDEDFLKYDFLSYFKYDIQNFYGELNQKIIKLCLFLEEIDTYKKCKAASKKSSWGNKKIDWNTNVNKLVAFYLMQIRDGLIVIKEEDLGPFLINNYTCRGKPLNEFTIPTYLDPNKRDDDLPKSYTHLNLKDFL